MPGAKSTPTTAQEEAAPRQDDHHRSIQRIAARLLYVEKEEEDGLIEVDNVAAGTGRAARMRFWIVSVFFVLFSLIALVALLAWGIATANGDDLGPRADEIIIVLILLAAAPIVYWRQFQYGLGLALKKRPPLYGKGRQSTIDMLEKLFDHLGRRTGPKAYFYDRKGIKRPVNRHFFHGRLRGLLLAEEARDRSLVMPPKGFWFDAPIYIEAEPEEIIHAVNASPRSKRGTVYDYEAMLLTLIEQPALRKIDPQMSGVETRVMKLVRARCEASDDHDNDISVPEDTELRKFAKRIIAAIKINRPPASPSA